jgi:AcrR family transcriptional regulator
MSDCSGLDEIRAIVPIENSRSEPTMTPLPEPRKTPVQARSRQPVEMILEATADALAERGYAGTDTNLVAARAGVSLGSIYQYFPNKDALVTAPPERHAARRCAIIEDAPGSAHPCGLSGHIEAVVHALLAAHRLDPASHKVLARQLPFFDAPKDQSSVDKVIFERIPPRGNDRAGDPPTLMQPTRSGALPAARRTIRVGVTPSFLAARRRAWPPPIRRTRHGARRNSPAR